MASNLLDSKHNLTEVQDVLDKLRRDDKAFFDEKKMVRKVPIFAYDVDGKPERITFWQERKVTASWEEAQLRHLDYYNERRGWIREGKKAERDYDYQPAPLED
jgi:hypothetical protein